MITRGDVLDVIVQEVDKDRGRIGLKLVAKHENGSLVQPEELIERAKNAPPRERARSGTTAAAGPPRWRPRPRQAARTNVVLALAAIRLGLALAGLEAAIAAGATRRAAGLAFLLGAVAGSVFVLTDWRGRLLARVRPVQSRVPRSGGGPRCAPSLPARSGSSSSLRSRSFSVPCSRPFSPA